MRNPFSSALCLFWAVLLASVAFGLILGFQEAVDARVSLLGVTLAFASSAAAKVSAFGMAVTVALTAVLFIWAFVLNALGAAVERGEQMEVLTIAHSLAALSATAVLVFAAVLAGKTSVAPLALQVAALAASYVACQFEHLLGASRRKADADQVLVAARAMAAGAAYNTMLSRLTGRQRQSFGSFR